MHRKIVTTICVLSLFSILILGISVDSVAADPVTCSDSYCYALPVVQKPYGIFHGELVINHENIDISQIPDEWLDKAKEIAFHYGHTSHGGQIMEGLGYIESYVDPDYDVSSWNLGDWNEHLTDGNLPINPVALNIYDGNYDPAGTDNYIEPGDYWEGSTGIYRTTTTAASGNFDYSMWSWCGQADYYSNTQINTYLAQMKAFETAFPEMRFIIMTGHNVRNPGTSLLAHNQMMRDYAIANDMILFDFADIETYDPDGHFYNPTEWNYADGDTGTCPWCTAWCTKPENVAYCTNLPSCTHTNSDYGGLFCKMKAQAFWWMMARLAGWDGTP